MKGPLLIAQVTSAMLSRWGSSDSVLADCFSFHGLDLQSYFAFFHQAVELVSEVRRRKDQGSWSEVVSQRVLETSDGVRVDTDPAQVSCGHRLGTWVEEH